MKKRTGGLRAKLGTPEKQDSSPAAGRAKVKIREMVLAAIGADQARVFDAFAGSGHMHQAVWQQAHDYVGCDLRFFREGPKAFVADNRRVMRNVDLERFNVFDLDAYGSPWDQVIILTARRTLQPGELLGLVLTEGSALKLKFSSLPDSLQRLTGILPRPGLGRHVAEVVDKALLATARRLGATIERRWQATGKVGSQVSYIGLVLRGTDNGG